MKAAGLGPVFTNSMNAPRRLTIPLQGNTLGLVPFNIPRFWRGSSSMHMRKRLLPSIFLALVFLLPSVLSSAKDAAKALPQRYRDWLAKDVVYIVTNQER